MKGEELIYLCPSVEAEPNARPGALLLLRVPLRSKKCKAGGDSGLKHAQKESDGDRASVILYGCEACKDRAPHDDVERRCRMSVHILSTVHQENGTHSTSPKVDVGGAES